MAGVVFGKSFDGVRALADAYNGTYRAGGATLTNSAGSPDVSGPTDAFLAVEAGDTFFISGEGKFTVTTKTDDENLILDANVVAAHVAVGVWRAYDPAGAIDAGDVLHVIQDSHNPRRFFVLFESETFVGAGLAS